MLLEYGSQEVYPLSPQLAEELGAGMEMLHSYLTDSLYSLMAGKDIRETWLYVALLCSPAVRCQALQRLSDHALDPGFQDTRPHLISHRLPG